MYAFRCREIRSYGGSQHDCFAQKWRMLDENRADNDREKKNVAQPLHIDHANTGFQLSSCCGCAAKIMSINIIKCQEERKQRDRPGQPAMLNRPPERHAFEIAKEERRSHRQLFTSPVGQEKEEKRGGQT